MLADYESVLDEIVSGLAPETWPAAVALAAYPEKIRGYGPVKDAAIDRAHATREELRRAFRSGARPAQAAE